MNNKTKAILGALLIVAIATPAFAGPHHRHHKHHNEGVHLAAEIIGLVGKALNIVNPTPTQTVVVTNPAPVQTVVVTNPAPQPIIVTPPPRPVVIRHHRTPPKRPAPARPPRRGGHHGKPHGGHRR